MAKLDLQSIKLKISLSKNATDQLRSKLVPIANKKLEEAKDQLLKDLNDNSITQEIINGPDATNISGTLDGKGNIFSFFGFKEDREPIKEFEDYLEENIKINPPIQGRDNLGRFANGGDQLLFDFKINLPTKQEIAAATPLDFEPKSWVFSVEQGLSGFSNYIYWKRKGRSNAGLQANNGREKNGQFNGEGAPIQLRPGRFKNTSYFSPMYNKFLSNFKTTVRL